MPYNTALPLLLLPASGLAHKSFFPFSGGGGPLRHEGSAHTVGGTQTFDRVLLSNSTYPTAKCTDGTQAGYYFRPSSTASLQSWVVYLEGGGWCWDLKSCEERCGTPGIPSNSSLCSSSVWSQTLDLEGIMEPTAVLPSLATANKVFVRYCTSDAHMGNAGPSSSSFGWHFRGAEVIYEFFFLACSCSRLLSC